MVEPDSGKLVDGIVVRFLCTVHTCFVESHLHFVHIFRYSCIQVLYIYVHVYIIYCVILSYKEKSSESPSNKTAPKINPQTFPPMQYLICAGLKKTKSLGRSVGKSSIRGLLSFRAHPKNIPDVNIIKASGLRKIPERPETFPTEMSSVWSPNKSILEALFWVEFSLHGMDLVRFVLLRQAEKLYGAAAVKWDVSVIG